MLRAHVTGIAVVGLMPRAEAERRVAHACRLAGDWPLRFTIEDA